MIFCGLSLLLSLIESTAVPWPAEKLYLTVMSQEAPGARPLPQVLVCEKSFGLVPPIVMPPIVSGACPVFVRVAVCGGGIQHSDRCLILMKVRSTGTSFTLPVVSMTVAVLVGSEAEVAVTVTVESAGSAPGAM